MKYTKLLANGQITIPSSMQSLLGIRPGDQLSLEIVKGELIVRPATRKCAARVTITATRFRTQMFTLLDQLADGELDRVIVTHKKLPPIQILYDGHIEDGETAAEEATSV